MASSKQEVVLITGCSTGIGLSTAVMLAKDAEKRFKVYATMRNLGKKEALETEGKDVLGTTLIIEQLDVCSEDQINKVVDDILAKEGKLDVLGKPVLLSLAHSNKHHCQKRLQAYCWLPRWIADPAPTLCLVRQKDTSMNRACWASTC